MSQLQQEKHNVAGRKLLSACIQDGFFYLDLQSHDSHVLLGTVERLFDLAKDIFELPLEEKLKYEVNRFGPVTIAGYKPAGRHTGVLEGRRDGFENFQISRNAVLNLYQPSCRCWPAIVDQNRAVVESAMSGLHEIGVKILSTLSEAMGLNNDELLEQKHRENVASTTSLAMLKYLPNQKLADLTDHVGHMAHTDVGSLTILFCIGDGLQVLHPQQNKWVDVPSIPGHAIVNVGDSLSFLSNGRLRSSLHRVVPHVQSEQTTKYSVAYFLRPEEDVTFEDTDGRRWISRDWHRAKYAVFGAPLSEQRQSSMLTGRKGFVGLWDPPQSGHATK